MAPVAGCAFNVGVRPPLYRNGATPLSGVSPSGLTICGRKMHPGFVATRFGDRSGEPIARLLWVAKFFAISPAGRNNHLSRVLAGRGYDNGAILLQVPADHAIGGCARRPICFVATAR